jgi:hypothetical protein
MAKHLSYTIRHTVSGLLDTVTVAEYEARKKMSQNWEIAARHETDNTEKALEKPVAQLRPAPKPEMPVGNPPKEKE